MFIFPVIDRIIRAMHARFKPGQIGSVPVSHRLWTEGFIWWPVWPTDERRFFWLETVWRRRHATTGRWEYRSFRTEAEKEREAEDVACRPPLVH